MTSVTEGQATVEAAAPAEKQQAAKKFHDAPRNPKAGAQATKGAPNSLEMRPGQRRARGVVAAE